jgi:hypothetical protein
MILINRFVFCPPISSNNSALVSHERALPKLQLFLPFCRSIKILCLLSCYSYSFLNYIKPLLYLLCRLA